MPVGQVHFSHRDRPDLAGPPVHDLGALNHVFHFAAIGAGVHGKRAADAARDPAEGCQACKACGRGLTGRGGKERGCAADHFRALNADSFEILPQPDYGAGVLVVCKQGIGTVSEDKEWSFTVFTDSGR